MNLLEVFGAFALFVVIVVALGVTTGVIRCNVEVTK